MTRNPDMFFCERTPGGLHISEHACAKQFHRSKDSQKRLSQCVECEVGATLSEKHPNLVWRNVDANFHNTLKSYADMFCQEENRMERRNEEESDSIPAEDPNEVEVVGWEYNGIDTMAVYDMERDTLFLDHPIRVLMETMLFFAVRGILEAKTEKERELQRKWILSTKNKGVFSCKHICQCLGISHSWLVRNVKNLNYCSKEGCDFVVVEDGPDQIRNRDRNRIRPQFGSGVEREDRLAARYAGNSGSGAGSIESRRAKEGSSVA